MRLRLAVLVVLTLLTLGYRGAVFYTYFVAPELRSVADITPAYQDGSLVVVDVDPEMPAYVDFEGRRKVPEVGDRIIAIYDLRGRGGPVESYFDYGALRKQVGSEFAWSMAVERPQPDGSTRQVILSMHPPRPFELTAIAWVAGIGIDVYLPLLVVIAALLIGFKRPQDPRAYVGALLLICFSAAFQRPAVHLAPGWREASLFLMVTTYAWLPYLLLRFFTHFPKRTFLDRWVPFLRWGFLLGTLGFWALALLVQFTQHMSFAMHARVLEGLGYYGLTSEIYFAAFRIFGAAAYVYALISMAFGVFGAKARSDRRRMIWIASGVVVGFLPVVWLQYANTQGFENPSLVSAIIAAVAGIFPLSFIYAVVRYRVFGIRVMLRRGLQYAVVSRGFLAIEGVVIFAILYFAAVPLVERYFRESDPRLALMSAAIITLVLLAGVPKLNARILPLIDRRFFRDPYDAQRILADLSHAMRECATSPAELLERVCSKLLLALHPCQVAVFLHSGNWSGTRPLAGERGMTWVPQLVHDALPKRFELVLHKDHPSREDESEEGLPGKSVLSSRTSLARFLAGAPDGPSALLDVFSVDRVLDDGLSLASWHMPDKEAVADQVLFEHFDTRLVVPLATGGSLLGFVLLGEKLSQEPYSQEDDDLLLAVAEQASVALDYSQLIARVAEQEALRREMQIAKDVQAKLFPQTLPEMATLEYTGLCRTAREVGGDYYDFLELDRQRLGIALGDIAGKGISASLLMASLQALLRSRTVALGNDLETLVRELNLHLCATTEAARYATFFVGTYDDEKRTLHYVNAGHTPPMVLRKGEDGDGVSVRRLEPGGTVLGLFKNEVYSAGSITALPGDTLLIFSDGLTEAMNEDGEMFGEERIVELAASQAGETVEAFTESLFAAVDAFVGDVAQQDDMTLISARVVK